MLLFKYKCLYGLWWDETALPWFVRSPADYLWTLHCIFSLFPTLLLRGQVIVFPSGESIVPPRFWCGHHLECHQWHICIDELLLYAFPSAIPSFYWLTLFLLFFLRWTLIGFTFTGFSPLSIKSLQLLFRVLQEVINHFMCVFGSWRFLRFFVWIVIRDLQILPPEFLLLTENELQGVHP